MAGLFIDDGWTLEHTIPGRGLIPPLTIHYRPALSARVRRWHREREQARQKDNATEIAEAEVEADARFLGDQIVNWNAPAPLTHDTFRKLWPSVLGSLLDVVSGFTVPDKTGLTPLEQAEKNSG